MIPYGLQETTQKDIGAVVDVLQSDFISRGPKMPEVEQAVAAKVTAISALHLACRALGVSD